MAEGRIVVKMTEIAPVRQALDEAARQLTAERERADALAVALAALTADEWAGWGYDEMAGMFVCFYCQARTEEDDGGYQHKPDCPLTQARVLLGTQPQETAEE